MGVRFTGQPFAATRIADGAIALGRLDVVGALNVDGAVDFDGALDVAGAALFRSTIEVDGQANFDGAVDIDANVSVDGNLTMESGRALLFDDGLVGAPGIARRAGTTTGLFATATTVQTAVGGANILSASSTAVATQVALQVDSRITSRASTGLVASTTQTQAAATQIPTNVNTATFATVANANDAGKMPTAAANVRLLVINDGAQILQLFPDTGDNFEGLAANASTTIAAGAEAEFWAKDANTWERVVLT